jgi:pyruvate/2-oxoglutarate dehydrogenase complex dihydrolipoamide dehydrogenase (E3) component
MLVLTQTIIATFVLRHFHLCSRNLRFQNILIATGGWPSAIKVHGGELAITSNEAFYLPEAPRNPLVFIHCAFELSTYVQ